MAEPKTAELDRFKGKQMYRESNFEFRDVGMVDRASDSSVWAGGMRYRFNLRFGTFTRVFSDGRIAESNAYYVEGTDALDRARRGAEEWKRNHAARARVADLAERWRRLSLRINETNSAQVESMLSLLESGPFGNSASASETPADVDARIQAVTRYLHETAGDKRDVRDALNYALPAAAAMFPGFGPTLATFFGEVQAHLKIYSAVE